MTVGTAPAPLSGQSAGSPDYYNIPMTVGAVNNRSNQIQESC